jgi:hypothetical protein
LNNWYKILKLLSIADIFFLAGLYYLVKPSHAALGQPLPQRLPGWAAEKGKSHAAGPATNSTILVFFAGWFDSCQPSVYTIPM